MLTKERMKSGTGWVNRYIYCLLSGEVEACPDWARELAISFIDDLLKMANCPTSFSIGDLYCVGYRPDGFGGHRIWAAWLNNGETFDL